MKKFVSLILTAVLLANMFIMFAVPASADESKAAAYIKAAERYEEAGAFSMAAGAYNDAGNQYESAGDYTSAVKLYLKAGECFEMGKEFSNAGNTFESIARVAQKKADELQSRSTGSTLSEGNIWIVIAIAAAVVFGLGGFFIGTKKKKKPALAGGTDKTDEE